MSARILGLPGGRFAFVKMASAEDLAAVRLDLRVEAGLVGLSVPPVWAGLANAGSGHS